MVGEENKLKMPIRIPFCCANSSNDKYDSFFRIRYDTHGWTNVNTGRLKRRENLGQSRVSGRHNFSSY